MAFSKDLLLPSASWRKRYPRRRPDARLCLEIRQAIQMPRCVKFVQGENLDKNSRAY